MKSSQAFIAATALVALSGCATQSITYQQDHSQAYNIAHAAGLYEASDHAVSKDQSESLTHAAMGIAGSTASFNTDFGLGLSLGKATALGIAGWLFSPPGQMERDTVLAWIPANQAGNAEEATAVLSSALYEAVMETLGTQGLSPEVEYRDRERHALWHSYVQTRISYTQAGKECGVIYDLYPDQVSDKAPIPDFILSDAQGYRFWAGHDIRYPHFDIGCVDEDPAATLQVASAISSRLPSSVYLYMAPRGAYDSEQRTMPMVLDHGKPLLFITAEGS